MTVKELREILKDVPMERGTLSKLKRKKDLIIFLENQLEHIDPTISNQPVANNDNRKQILTPSDREQPRQVHLDQPLEEKKTRIGNMPSLENQERELSLFQNRSKNKPFKEFIFNRYPPLHEHEIDNNSTDVSGVHEEDIRQKYHPIMLHPDVINESSMELMTVGTASCYPSVTRGVSCTALRIARNDLKRSLGLWIFDAGESTQIQVQRRPFLKTSSIRKIFLTHCHGDHTFGLVGLLCLTGQNMDRSSEPIEIYGPEGLRMWLRISIRYSVSRIVPNYRVHELMNVPMAPEWRRKKEYKPGANAFYNSLKDCPPDYPYKWKKGLAGDDLTSWISQAKNMNLEPSNSFGEVEGGRNIYPDFNHPQSFNDAPVWDILEDHEEMKVYAAPMSHTVPCVGYVVQEPNKPGRLNHELVEPIVRRNLDALREAGFKRPMKVMAVIKDLPPDSSFTFPDGTVLHQDEAVEPSQNGRKIIICGDTADASPLTYLGKNADILVHEATNSYIHFLDQNRNKEQVTRETLKHGHSTPETAGLFCKEIGAKRLILNHFSPRYRGDASLESISTMTIIEKIAIKASGKDASKVAASWDFMRLPIPENKDKEVEMILDNNKMQKDKETIEITTEIKQR